MVKSRKLMLAALAAGVLSTSTVATFDQAEARHWRGHGGAIAAGVIGGLAAGALIGAASSAYAYPYGYYGYGHAPVSYGYYPASYGYVTTGYAAPACWIERQRVRIDPWTVVIRRVQVCE